MTTEGLQLGLFTQDLAQQIDPSKVALDVVMETVRAQNVWRGGRGGSLAPEVPRFRCKSRTRPSRSSAAAR